MRAVQAYPLDDVGFEPFGRVLRVPAPDTAAPTISRPGVTLFGDLARIAAVGDDVEFGLAVLAPREPGLDRLERHGRTAELLFAVRGDFVLAVAPPGGDVPLPEEVCCFVVRTGEGCVLKPSAWHWAPYPMHGTCEVLVGFRAGTPHDDMHIVPLHGGEDMSVEWSS